MMCAISFVNDTVYTYNCHLSFPCAQFLTFKTDRSQEAEQCYSKALSINPNSANANTNMANLLRVGERYKQAEIRYRKALSLRADDPMLFYNLALVLEKLGKLKVSRYSFHDVHSL
jgi:Flp pilus assembly protein TadD